MEDNTAITNQTALAGAPKKRFWELDFLRGVCVILMVFDHIMFTIGYVMPMLSPNAEIFWADASNWVDDVYWMGGLRTFVRPITLFLFFFICGICCTLSKSNFRRGVLCFMVGCLITCVTVIVDRIADLGVSIYFGVLHMLGVSMILYAAFDKLGNQIKKLGKSEKAKTATRLIGDYLAPTIGLILVIVYFSCLGHIEDGMVMGDIAIENQSLSVFTSLFMEVQFSSVDYIIYGADFWPILPYAAVVWTGGFIGRAIYNNDKTKFYLARLDGKWNKPVCYVGRHAIIIYVAHQVIVFALLALITLIAA